MFSHLLSFPPPFLPLSETFSAFLRPLARPFHTAKGHLGKEPDECPKGPLDAHTPVSRTMS